MAIKQIYIGNSNDSKRNAKEVKKEVELLKELVHPNIVKYYGSEIDK